MPFDDFERIKNNQELYGDISTNDEAEILADNTLSVQETNAAVLSPETYKQKKKQYSVEKEAEKYPALFSNLAIPSVYAVSAAYKDELKKYEDDFFAANKQQGAIENAWNSFWYSRKSLEIASLDAERMDAIRDNDEAKLSELDNKIRTAEEELSRMDAPSDIDSVSGSVGAIAASFARELPALVATGVATTGLAALAGISGGASTAGAAVTAGRFASALSRVRGGYNAVRAAKAARAASWANDAISAGIIYNDTTDLERGSAYRELSEQYPNMSEDEKQRKAWTIGRVNGGVEAASAGLFGLGARAAKLVSKPARQALGRKLVSKTIDKTGLDEAKRTALKNVFYDMSDKGLIDPAMAADNWFIGRLTSKIEEVWRNPAVSFAHETFDYAMEGYTEVFQDAVGEVVKEWSEGKKGEVTLGGAFGEAFDRLNEGIAEAYNYLVNDGTLSEETSDRLRKMKGIGFASALFGGVGHAVGYGLNRIGRDRATNPAMQIESANQTIAKLDRVLEQKKNSSLYRVSPEAADMFYSNVAKHGNLPKTLSIDENKLRALIEEAKNDPTIQAQIAKANLADKIGKAEAGMVEMTYDEFNKAFLDPENDTLYQKIKNDITANPAMMTKNEAVDWLNNIVENSQNVAEAEKDPNSLYNKIYEWSKQNGAEDSLAASHAVTAQYMFSTIGQFGLSPKDAEKVAQEIGFRMEVEQREKGEGILSKLTKRVKEAFTGKSGFVTDQSKAYARMLLEDEMAKLQKTKQGKLKEGKDVVQEETRIKELDAMLGDEGEIKTTEAQENFIRAIESKDIDTLSDIISKNRQAKKFFESLEGVKLPSTKSGIAETLGNWARVDVAGEIGNVLYQSGFVSMKGTLEGDYLDWGKHRGTGEGNEAHGAGIYALKDKDLNKANYYSWMSRQVLKIDGKEYSGGEFNNVISLLDAGRSLEEVIKTYDEGLNAISEKINEIQKDIDDIRKKYPNTQLINEAFYDLESAQELKNTGVFTQEDISRLTAELDSVSEKTTMEEKIKARDLRNLEKTRGYFVRLMDELLEVYDVISKGNVSFEKTGAQYEVEIPESKYLLHEEKRFSQQSKFVQKRLNSIMADYGMYSYDKELFNEAWKEFGSTSSLAEMLTWNNLVNILRWSNSGKENVPTLVEQVSKDKEYLESRLDDDEYISKVYDSKENALKFVEAYEEAIQFASKYKIDDIAKKEGFFEKNDLRGEDIYETLVEKLGSKTDASLALMNEGIKGIEYEGGRDGTGYVIFRGEDIPIKQRLLQNLSGIAGSTTFTPTETVLYLSKISNPTTFIHEMGHIFIKQLLDMYNKGQLNPIWQKRAEDFIEFCGFEKDARGVIMSGDKYVAAQEKFAEAITTYFWEGKAPKPYLKAMFDAIAEWFANFYNMIRKSPLGLTPKIREAFDSIFIPYEEQQQVQAEKRLGFLPKPDGMSDAQYEQYIAEKRALTSYSATEEIKAAAKIAKLRTEKVYQEEYEASLNEAYQDLGTMPMYQMIEDVAVNKILESTLNLPEGMALRKEYTSADRGVAVQQVLAKYSKMLQTKENPNSVLTEEDLVRILNDTPTRSAMAQYIAERHMDEWLRENYPTTENLNAEFASKNERAVRLATMEYMMLAGIDMKNFSLEYNNILAAGETLVQTMPMNKAVNVERWLEMENKLLKKYEYEKSNKKKAEIKRYQAVLSYYAMKSKDIRTDYRKFSKKVRKYRKDPDSAGLRQMSGATWDLLKTILYNYNFTQSKPRSGDTLLAKMTKLQSDLLNEGFTSVDILDQYKYTLPQDKIDHPMQYGEFSEMSEIFRLIEGMGKAQKQVIVEGKRISIEQSVDDIVELFDKENIKTIDERSTLGKLLDEWQMTEATLREILPTRVFLDYIAPFSEGLAKKDLQIREWEHRQSELLKMYDGDYTKKIMVGDRAYTVLDMLVIMLNSGNEHNFNCMVKTLQGKFRDINYSADNMMEVLNAAPKELRQITRGIWQMFDENKEAFQEVQNQIDGKVIKFVEPDAYTFADGEVMEGGYYPAGTTAQIKDFADTQSMFRVDGVYASQSFQHDRQAGVHGDLDLTLNTLNAWNYKMASILHIAVPYNNLGKLLRNERAAITLGKYRVDSINNWMKIATTPDKVNPFIASVDALASIKILGRAPARIFTQISGIFPAMEEIGVKWVAGAIADTPNPIDAIKNASKLSAYMKARYTNPEEHLNLLVQSRQMFGINVEQKLKKGFEIYTNTAMFSIIWGDAIASYYTWNAEFNKQKAAGLSDTEASALADTQVRLLQGDSSAGSRPKGMQGNMRFFTKFASYFIGIYSLLRAKAERGTTVDVLVREGGLLTAVCLFGASWESLWKAITQWLWADDDDREKWEKKGITSPEQLFVSLMSENIPSTLGSALVPMYGLGNAAATALTTGNVYSAKNMQLDWMYNFMGVGQMVNSFFIDDEEKAVKVRKKGLKKILSTAITDSTANKVTDILIGD